MNLIFSFQGMERGKLGQCSYAAVVESDNHGGLL